MASHIERRKFLATLGGAAAWPLAVRAQQAGKLPTIGYLGSATPATQGQWVAAFVQRLRELGWIEGRTIAIEYRWAEGRTERAAEIAAELVQRKVDVSVTSGTAVVVAAMLSKLLSSEISSFVRISVTVASLAASTVTAHQLTESQQVATSPKTPAATSQPSDRQWDCNCICGCRSVMGEAGYRGCLR